MTDQAPTQTTEDLNPLDSYKILAKTIEVTNRDESFEFLIPSSLHELKIGAMVRRIRRDVDPMVGGPGEEYGWDPIVQMHTKAIAIFLVCLQKTSAQWVYTQDSKGHPYIDWQNWPPEHVERILEIALAFENGVARFRSGLHKAAESK